MKALLLLLLTLASSVVSGVAQPLPEATSRIIAVPPRATRPPLTRAAETPSFLSAVVEADGSVSLTWQAPIETITVAFEIIREANDNVQVFCVNPLMIGRSTQANSTFSRYTWRDVSFTHANATNATYRIKVKFADHDSAWSVKTLATAPINTLPPIPPPLTP